MAPIKPFTARLVLGFGKKFIDSPGFHFLLVPESILDCLPLRELRHTDGHLFPGVHHQFHGSEQSQAAFHEEATIVVEWQANIEHHANQATEEGLRFRLLSFLFMMKCRLFSLVLVTRKEEECFKFFPLFSHYDHTNTHTPPY